jgi:CDP-glycerol glycerophosphotransferase (TagB/SpsB family)
MPPGAQLVIKRHPTMAQAGWDDAEAYRFIARQVGLEPVLTDPRESNPLLLAAADAVLPIKFSSTISEAINADKPVILLPVGRDWLHDALLQSGTVVFADDEASLQQALARCLYDADFQRELTSARRRFKEAYPHVPPAEAVENIIRYIDDILAGRTDSPTAERRFERNGSNQPASATLETMIP